MTAKTTRLFALPMLGILLTGCSTIHTDTPEWALFPEKTYPPAQYAVAPGSGSNHRLAKKDAARTLKNFFTIQMTEAQTVTRRLYRSLGLPANFRPVFDENTPWEKPTDLTPPRIQYGKHYTDFSGIVHTLAFFDRQTASKPFVKQMQAGTARVRSQLAAATGEPEPLARYAHFRAALFYALQTETPAARIALLDPQTASSIQTGYSLTDVLSQTAAAATNITFTIAATGDSQHDLSLVISNTLRGFGFTPSANGDLRVTASLQADPVKIDNSITATLQYHLNIDVQTRSGKTVASIHKKKNEHLPLIELQEQTARSIEKTVHQTLHQQVSNTINRIAGVKG